MSHTRLDCPADLAIWLTSNPVLSAWGLLHSLKIVSTEMGVFVANWPLIASHAPTMETGKQRCRKVRK